MVAENKRHAHAHATPAGQYYLMEKIAQGGMAEIFKGLSYDINGLKKTVCIKKILPHIAASQEFIDSLIDEAKVTVSLSHGNIAQIYDLGKVGDDYFMVMEFVEGRSLSQINKRCLKNDALIPVPHLCFFMAEILNGLNYIHLRTDERGASLGIVHRDISPQNIMVSFSGTVKIIDFGIAKSKMKAGTTDSGILKGKFAYMSPEQARGDPIDHRSDIFSLAVIFHEMLTGKRLFKEEDNRDTLRNVRRAKVDAPSSIRPNLPPELDEIVLRALAKDRRERYPFASEMHDELVKFLYTTYPDFKQSDVAAFVLDLFKDDRPKPDEERESRTPYLIIDHTSSALMDEKQYEETGIAKAPIDVGHYMVGKGPAPDEDEHTPATAVDHELMVQNGGGKPAPVQPEPSESKVQVSRAPRLRRLGKIIGIGAGAVIIAAGLAMGIWHWVTRPTPPTEPVAPPPVGQILVSTNPPDANIFVDNEFIGSGSPMAVTDLAVDTPHMLKVEKDEYIPQTRRFTLKKNEFKDYAITLNPVVPPTSSIVITTTPPGAVVYLDDKETKFTTPATIKNVEPDTKHTLGLHLPSYRFWTTSVTTRPNETQNFHVQLALDYGSLRITAHPEGALVLINGAPAGQTPLTRDNLEPNATYRVEIWQEGYQPAVREVRIRAGATEELHLILEMSPQAPAAEPPAAPPVEAPVQPEGPQADPIGPAGL